MHNPLVEVSSEGRLISVVECTAPDRMAYTEFWAGILVPDFPADYREAFSAMRSHTDIPLPEQLGRFSGCPGGILVVISGLDYTTMRLTPQSQIRKI